MIAYLQITLSSWITDTFGKKFAFEQWQKSVWLHNFFCSDQFELIVLRSGQLVTHGQQSPGVGNISVQRNNQTTPLPKVSDGLNYRSSTLGPGDGCTAAQTLHTERNFTQKTKSNFQILLVVVALAVHTLPQLTWKCMSDMMPVVPALWAPARQCTSTESPTYIWGWWRRAGEVRGEDDSLQVAMSPFYWWTQSLAWERQPVGERSWGRIHVDRFLQVQTWSKPKQMFFV